MLRGLFKKKKQLYISQGNEKGQYLPLDGLGLVLVHERLHLTQLQLQKPGHSVGTSVHPGPACPPWATPQPLPLPSLGASGAPAVQRALT